MVYEERRFGRNQKLVLSNMTIKLWFVTMARILQIMAHLFFFPPHLCMFQGWYQKKSVGGAAGVGEILPPTLHPTVAPMDKKRP